MTNIRQTLSALLVLVAAMWLAFNDTRPWPWFRRPPDTPRRAVENDTRLVLTGILEPFPSIPIQVPHFELTVPLGGWVRKGQIVGETAPEISPQAITQARLLAEDATATLEVTEQKLRESGLELSRARLDAGDTQAQMLAAENTAREAGAEYRRILVLFNQGAASRVTFDAAAARFTATESALTALRGHYHDACERISDLLAQASEVRKALGDAAVNKDRAEAAARKVEDSAAFLPFVSPADGMVVAMRTTPGMFAIATDAASLCAYTDVLEEDLPYLQVDEPVSIVVDGPPGATFHARVRAIGGVAMDSPGGKAFPVLLAVDNPDRSHLAGQPVRILVPGIRLRPVLGLGLSTVPVAATIPSRQ